MATPVNVIPAALDFGDVVRGSFGPDTTPISVDLPSFAGGVQIREAPIDANLTVSITGDTAHFRIRDVFIMEWVMQPIDPGELPPGHRGPLPKVKALNVVGQTDGSSVVAVKKGQFVLVRVEYAALLIENTFTATLVIQGDTWDTVLVPLSLFLAEVITSASDSLNIAQGNQANLPIFLASVMGPGTDVTYEMSGAQLHTGLTLLPNGFHLNSKEAKSFFLTFQADRYAPLGLNDVFLEQLAFAPREKSALSIKVNIRHPQIIVNPAQPNKINVSRSGRTINHSISISISLSSGPETYVDLSPGVLPTGVSMRGGGFVQSDTINPWGSKVDNWGEHGHDPFIAENWDLIKANRNDAFGWRLHVSGEVFNVLEAVLAPILLGIGAVKYAIDNINIGSGGPSGSANCQEVYEDDEWHLVCQLGD
jgi:hypothetical protein